MVPTLLGPTELPKWASSLIGFALAVLLVAWFYLVTTTEPGTQIHEFAWKGPLMMALLVCVWMVWRGIRGTLRARHLRRNGIELDAELLQIRRKTSRHHDPEAQHDGVFKKAPSIASMDYVDYVIHHDDQHVTMKGAPMLLGPGARLGRESGTVCIQVDPNDLRNNRLMATPSHVTFVLRALQVLVGIGIGTFAVSLLIDAPETRIVSSRATSFPPLDIATQSLPLSSMATQDKPTWTYSQA